MSISVCRQLHKLIDAERFNIAAQHIVGKRLTFGQLTGNAIGQNEAELRC